MAISEQMLAMMLALHAPADAARTLGPEALAQPSGGVILADSSSPAHKNSNDFHFTHGQDKSSPILDSKPAKAQGLGDIKGESQDDKHKDEIDLQHGTGDHKGQGVQPLKHDAPGQ